MSSREVLIGGGRGHLDLERRSRDPLANPSAQGREIRSEEKIAEGMIEEKIPRSAGIVKGVDLQCRFQGEGNPTSDASNIHGQVVNVQAYHR